MIFKVEQYMLQVHRSVPKFHACGVFTVSQRLFPTVS